MFVLSLTPKGTPEQLEPVREAHHAWAAKGFEDGVLLAGGRLVPPTGGFLMARNDRNAVDAFIAAEPFSQRGLADIVVTEVNVMTTAPGLEGLRVGQTSRPPA
jgi:uncharacterized protein YciI